MNETIIEINELEKKMTGFIEIPRGNETTAYVFFQSKDNNKYLISTEKRKIMAAELRMGKYDRIMTIRRGEFTDTIKKEIACKEQEHDFFVDIYLTYYLTNPEVVYLKQIYNLTNELEKCLAGIEFELSGNYSFLAQAELRKNLHQLIKEKLNSLSYLKCSFQIKIDVDDSVKEIISRRREHEVKKADENLSAIEKKIELENNYELEQMRQDNEKQLKSIKINYLGELLQKYGSNAGNLISHVDGEITGTQLSEIINRTTRENREDLISTIIKLNSEGILSKDIAAQSSVSALGIESTGMLQLSTNEDEIEESIEAHNKFKWADTDGENEDLQ